MVPFKGRSFLRQYLPNKPKKWGFKLWGRCDASGFLHDFNVYQGKGTGIDVKGMKDCGLGGNVVISLCESLDRDCGYKVFADNFFSNFNMVKQLKSRGLEYTGTINKNRIHNAPLKSDNELNKKGRGSHSTVSVKDNDIALTKWKETKTVTMVSTYLTAEPVSKVTRYDKSRKVHVEVDRPNVVEVYNKKMGGVDLLDMMCSLYKRQIKGKRWYMYIFYHTLTIAMVNAWFLYKRDCVINGVRKPMPLKLFQSSVAEVFLKKDRPVSARVGRPLSMLQSPPATKKGHYTPAPPTEVRLDKVDHFPVAHQKRNRCRHCGNGYTQWKCRKCDVFLCLTPGAQPRNCFLTYHSN
ncbi:hypothetical protein SNE40_016236 [Patella caerulea]|uniref:PiggyBac transposable element-derived protein domain-containing protein n=1 Tax=Patella caerulea TaxID=87958 RepID=A0AAN8PCW4_PATCE